MLLLLVFDLLDRSVAPAAGPGSSDMPDGGAQGQGHHRPLDVFRF